MKHRKGYCHPLVFFLALSRLLSLGCASRSEHATPLGDDYTRIEAGTASLNPDGNAPGDEGGRGVQPFSASALEGPLSSLNSAGRTGAFYLPPGYNEQAIPLLVAYHATGGQGSDMVGSFRSLAMTSMFAIVAPDSRRSPAGDLTWEVGSAPGEVTEDYTHTIQCIAEVRANIGVRFDEQRVLAVGYSGGGSSAPYIATNETMFHAYAVMHGGVIEGGIGSNIVPGWFSTGDADTLRPPALVQQSVDYMTGLGFADLTFRTYPGGHALSAAELGDVVAWWLVRK